VADGRLDFSVDGDAHHLEALIGGYRDVEAVMQLGSHAGSTSMRLIVQWLRDGEQTFEARLGIYTADTGAPLLRAEMAAAGGDGPLWNRDIALPASDTDVRLRIGCDAALGLIEFSYDAVLFASYMTAGMTQLDATAFGLFRLESAASEGAHAAYRVDAVRVSHHFAAANAAPDAVYVNPAAAAPAFGTAGHPLARIAPALTLVRDGGTVHLAAGTYRTHAVIGPDIGQPALSLLTIAGESGAIIDGSGFGTGINVVDISSVHLETIEVRNCETGVHISSAVASALLDGVLLTANSGAGMIAEARDVVVRDAVVSGNGGRGLSFPNDRTSAEVERCMIQDNAGCGIVAWTQAFAVRDSFITGNTEGADDLAAGIEISGSNVTLNNTIADNLGGPGIHLTLPGSAQALVYNNLITTNGGGGIDATQVSGVLSIDYNNVWSNAGGDYFGVTRPGANSFAEDPGYVGSGDYHLGNESACIGRGDNAYAAGTGRRDIDGETRIQQGTVDLGADETPWASVALVTFADPNLENAVRVAIGKPTGNIYTRDLVGSEFTALTAHSAGIAELGGIEYCTELVSLNLDNNAIEDLSPLEELTELRTLVLSQNAIEDCAPLSGLINLTDLNLSYNALTDISPLARLRYLKYLRLGHNHITSVDALVNLTALRRLELNDNQLENVQALVDNPGINASLLIGADFVDLRGNPLSQQALCSQIPELLRRGVNVQYEGECSGGEGEGEGEGEPPVWSWGNNARGQLGAEGTVTFRSTPGLVAGLAAATGCAAGSEHSLAIGPGGTAWAWGNNSTGQLGDNTTITRKTPVQVGGLSRIEQVAAGDRHSMALDASGIVWAWGYNGNGQLGNATTINRPLPVQVHIQGDFTQIAAGLNHGLALKGDRTVWAWGDNTGGQLGDNSTVPRSTPVQVKDLTDVKAIAAGGEHSLAVRQDGTVWAWGDNRDGQLGNDTSIRSLVPIQVNGLSGIQSVAAGENHSLALSTTGLVYGWGANDDGQIGNGVLIDRSTPARLYDISQIAAIGAGASHSFAVGRNGALWAWGRNLNGQLGDGTQIRRVSPTAISTLSGVRYAEGGRMHSVALISAR